MPPEGTRHLSESSILNPPTKGHWIGVRFESCSGRSNSQTPEQLGGAAPSSPVLRSSRRSKTRSNSETPEQVGGAAPSSPLLRSRLPPVETDTWSRQYIVAHNCAPEFRTSLTVTTQYMQIFVEMSEMRHLVIGQANTWLDEHFAEY